MIFIIRRNYQSPWVKNTSNLNILTNWKEKKKLTMTRFQSGFSMLGTLWRRSLNTLKALQSQITNKKEVIWKNYTIICHYYCLIKFTLSLAPLIPLDNFHEVGPYNKLYPERIKTTPNPMFTKKTRLRYQNQKNQNYTTIYYM